MGYTAHSMSLLRSPHLHASLCAATIAVLMMVPAGALPEIGFSWLAMSLDQWIDKVQHFVAFMVMTVLVARSLGQVERVKRPVLMAALVTLGFSFFLELLQAPVPWRNFDIRDMVADTLGVLVALPIAAWVTAMRGGARGRSGSFG